MGNVVDLNSDPVPLGDDISPELGADHARYAEGVLTEKFIRMKYRFNESTWETLGNNDKLVEAIETEKIRRIRDGSTKREKSQQLITQAPDVLGGIMLDANASPKHRIDSAKALDAFTGNGPQAAPASDRFQITINLRGRSLHETSTAANQPLPREVREDHASYLDHSLKVLKQDKRAIFTAASHAQRAADFLHGLQLQKGARAA